VSYSPARPAATRPARATAAEVREALRNGSEIALLDVRPEGPFALGHPLFAASLPLGRLEAEVLDRLPRRSVPVVVYGDGRDGVGGSSSSDGEGGDPDGPASGADALALAAAARLRELGYTDVTLLDGGLEGWTASGGELFRDVNAPSKAFGELVAERAGTPFIPASDLAGMLAGDGDAADWSVRDGTGGGAGTGAECAPGGGAARCVVVDARRFDEFTVMNIPTATSVPGAELVLRAPVLAPDPETTIVVNCAGRTRSIIGAQSLINAGTGNRVVALRNGTIGWTLAGLDLEHGSQRRAPDTTPEAAARAQAAAWAVAERAGVWRISAAELRQLTAGAPADSTPAGTPGRTVYRFDVRTPEEYAAGHQPGFRSAPGGQLVQETDRYAPVRGALVVLADDGHGRAAMTASWLAQMNWDVAVAEPDQAAAPETGDWVPARPPAPVVPLATPEDVQGWRRDGTATVIDVEASPRFRAGRVPGARWALRADLPRIVRSLAGTGTRHRVVLTSGDGYLAAWAASDLAREGALGGADADVVVVVLAGGTRAWERSAGSLESGAPREGALLSEPVDVYRRPYEGTDIDPATMQAYLDWEYGLVAQLDRDGTHGFTVYVP
jgi:rhodanese-related sulfurtransferase